jgi:hypothetical protein
MKSVSISIAFYFNVDKLTIVDYWIVVFENWTLKRSTYLFMSIFYDKHKNIRDWLVRHRCISWYVTVDNRCTWIDIDSLMMNDYSKSSMNYLLVVHLDIHLIERIQQSQEVELMCKRGYDVNVRRSNVTIDINREELFGIHVEIFSFKLVHALICKIVKVKHVSTWLVNRILPILHLNLWFTCHRTIDFNKRNQCDAIPLDLVYPTVYEHVNSSRVYRVHVLSLRKADQLTCDDMHAMNRFLE